MSRLENEHAWGDFRGAEATELSLYVAMLVRGYFFETFGHTSMRRSFLGVVSGTSVVGVELGIVLRYGIF